MRLKFFPGSELAPPFLLGEVVDLDRPQHVVANVTIKENEVDVKIIVSLEETQVDEVHEFVSNIDFEQHSRVRIADIIHYTSRRKSMC